MRARLGLLMIFGIISCGNGGDKPKAAEVYLNPHVEKVVDTLTIERENWLFRFTEPINPYELGIYQKLEVLDEDSIVMTFEENLIEIQGIEFSNSHRYVIDLDSILYIMIPIDNRPEPNRYLVLESGSNSIKRIGLTDATTLDTIGELDDDGHIEFAGYRFHWQARNEDDTPDEEFFKEAFRVFEIQHGIQRDKHTEYLLQAQKTIHLGRGGKSNKALSAELIGLGYQITVDLPPTFDTAYTWIKTSDHSCGTRKMIRAQRNDGFFQKESGFIFKDSIYPRFTVSYPHHDCRSGDTHYTLDDAVLASKEKALRVEMMPDNYSVELVEVNGRTAINTRRWNSYRDLGLHSLSSEYLFILSGHDITLTYNAIGNDSSFYYLTEDLITSIQFSESDSQN